MSVHEKASKTREYILKLLADGYFHSGESIANELCITRAAVWKHAKALQKLGLDVFCVRGKGYKLVQPLELLDQNLIQQRLHDQKCLVDITILNKTDSTNGWCQKQLNKRECPALPLAVAAEWQSSGRGRRGRQWVTPFGSGLAFSLCHEVPLIPAQLSGLSVVVGIAAANVLSRYGIADIGIKWPNDLICRAGEQKGHKVGGILVEINGESSGSTVVVVGIGININVPDKAMVNVQQPWVNVEDLLEGKSISRNTLLADLLVVIKKDIDDFARAGFASFLPQWQKYDDLDQQAIYVIQGHQNLSGIAKGLSPNGNLYVETQSGLVEVSGGEVSIRRR